jgi:hypothetical protein
LRLNTKRSGRLMKSTKEWRSQDGLEPAQFGRREAAALTNFILTAQSWTVSCRNFQQKCIRSPEQLLERWFETQNIANGQSSRQERCPQNTRGTAVMTWETNWKHAAMYSNLRLLEFASIQQNFRLPVYVKRSQSDKESSSEAPSQQTPRIIMFQVSLPLGHLLICVSVVVLTISVLGSSWHNELQRGRKRDSPASSLTLTRLFFKSSDSGSLPSC